MFLSWQKRREDFNHKWLKNDLMMALRAWPNLLDGIDEDPEAEKELVTKYVNAWPTKKQEAAALIEDFVDQMSPKTLFNEYPLSNCDKDTKQWLGELIHQLWLIRCSVMSIVVDAHKCLNEVSVAHENLITALKGCKDTTKAKKMKPFKEQFEDFRSACEALGISIEKFPSEVSVV